MANPIDNSFPNGARTEAGETFLGDASNYTKFDTSGHQTMIVNARPWRDELGDSVALQQTGVGVSRNADQSYVTFATTANLNDYMYTNIQLNHDRDSSVNIDPHLHFFQTLNSFPNFLLQYRWQVNGSHASLTWTNITCVVPVFSYPGGVFHQIADTQAGITPAVGTTLSDIVQFRVLRDTNNDSTVFSATDAYTSTVGVLAFDVHLQLNSLGSTDEYTK